LHPPHQQFESHTTMKPLRYLAAAFVTAATIASGHALASTCRADPLICPSTMPVGGFCECKASGTTIAGTVAATLAPDEHYNATAGGCGAQSDDPGCRGLPMHDMPLQLR
jgi:hypothetical protein